MPYGRGGAGNIQNVEDTSKKIAEDLEANRAAAEDSSRGSISEQATAETTSSSNQQYAYTGRGGAGNWYSPRELSESGQFVSTEESSNLGPSTGQPARETRYTGRGGSGNYAYNTEEERAKREAEQKEIELKDWVERDVEAGLSPLDKAHLRSNGNEPE